MTSEKPRPRWRRLLGTLVLAYLGGLAVLMFLENQLVFPAPKYPQGDWEPSGLVVEDVFFESEDGTRLHGWYVEPPRPRGYLLYCHGNGEHVAYLTPELELLRDRLNLAVFAFDYRGYGRSDGSPAESGVLQDGRAAHAWLVARSGLSSDQIILMGRSLGGAVAIDVAARTSARALIVENTFTNMREVAARLYWWAPVRWLMRTEFDSISKLRSYNGPLLLSHGTVDELVPVEHGRALFDAAPTQQKRRLEYPDAGHNDPRPSSYYDDLEAFLTAS